MNRSELNEKAKKYLANAGFGTGTNITLHGAKCLMVDFHMDETKLKDIGVLADVSVSDSSDFELQRLFEWLQETKREPAQTKFTAGMTRNVAREFEYLLKHSR
jgi:hypothetical protein